MARKILEKCWSHMDAFIFNFEDYWIEHIPISRWPIFHHCCIRQEKKVLTVIFTGFHYDVFLKDEGMKTIASVFVWRVVTGSLRSSFALLTLIQLTLWVSNLEQVLRLQEPNSWYIHYYSLSLLKEMLVFWMPLPLIHSFCPLFFLY